jgi:hypothetical protein
MLSATLQPSWKPPADDCLSDGATSSNSSQIGEAKNPPQKSATKELISDPVLVKVLRMRILEGEKQLEESRVGWNVEMEALRSEVEVLKSALAAERSRSDKRASTLREVALVAVDDKHPDESLTRECSCTCSEGAAHPCEIRLKLQYQAATIEALSTTVRELSEQGHGAGNLGHQISTRSTAIESTQRADRQRWQWEARAAMNVVAEAAASSSHLREEARMWKGRAARAIAEASELKRALDRLRKATAEESKIFGSTLAKQQLQLDSFRKRESMLQSWQHELNLLGENESGSLLSGIACMLEDGGAPSTSSSENAGDMAALCAQVRAICKWVGEDKKACQKAESMKIREMEISHADRMRCLEAQLQEARDQVTVLTEAITRQFEQIRAQSRAPLAST